jgi:hypothetical protein
LDLREESEDEEDDEEEVGDEVEKTLEEINTLNTKKAGNDNA